MAARKKATAKTTTRAEVTSAPLHDVVRVEPGGIDPRLVEIRDAQREAESDVTLTPPSGPTIDEELVRIRDETRKREEELANRSTTEDPRTAR